MIPVKLKLRNFMCYRENVPALSFEGIHIACLCGDNGNGKSALIDAMTWALWGEARAKSDDDLIYSGAREMEVEFEFDVGPQRYRIIRKHSKPKRWGSSGQTLLEFQAATTDGFRPITLPRITETQQKINDVLHMNYDTFINSAFLRQGHADEFTTRRPAERKEVLASILGLSLYDHLEDQARELAKQQGDEKLQLEHSIKEIDEELALKPECLVEMERARNSLSLIESAAREKKAVLDSLKQKKGYLEAKSAQFEQLEAAIAERENSLRIMEAQVEQTGARIRGYEALLAQRQAIEEGYSRYAESRRLNDELNQKLAILAKLTEHRSQLIKTIDRVQHELITQHTVAENRRKDLDAKVSILPLLRQQMQQLQAEFSRLAEHESALSQRKQVLQELQGQVSRLESEKSQLEGAIKEADEKLGLLAGQTEARCPLCESELGTDGLKRIESKYLEEKHTKLVTLNSNQVELAHKKDELEGARVEIAKQEASLNQAKVTAQSQAGIVSKETGEAEQAEKDLALEKEKLAALETRMARKEFAVTEQAALSDIEGQMSQLNYSSEQHEAVRGHVTDLQRFELPKRQLEEAEARIGPEKEVAAKAGAAVQEIRLSLAADRLKRQNIADELSLLPKLTNDLAQAEDEHQKLSKQQKEAEQALWNVTARLERCAELETKRKEKESQLAESAKQEGIYQELARAFGKEGIQALLIEKALPEVEAEANTLLARMTDNRMHVKIEPQRETKRGDVVETLDIKISDELGTRNYEMFSGGEAFRINLAIRIALSKLLARRAGAPLPTIIIDEGFGTQDSTGLEKLKEAITSIQDDFEKIIVITHIEDLRDAFPTRIDVVKTAEGATLSIS